MIGEVFDDVSFDEFEQESIVSTIYYTCTCTYMYIIIKDLKHTCSRELATCSMDAHTCASWITIHVYSWFMSCTCVSCLSLAPSSSSPFLSPSLPTNMCTQSSKHLYTCTCAYSVQHSCLLPSPSHQEDRVATSLPPVRLSAPCPLTPILLLTCRSCSQLSKALDPRTVQWRWDLVVYYMYVQCTCLNNLALLCLVDQVYMF